MLVCIDWIWEGYKNLERNCVPCVIPPCTLKSDEPEPGLQPVGVVSILSLISRG